MITRLCLVRHGETLWNAERRIQGQIDIGLNQHGLRQARAAGDYLRDEGATALYSSDLSRAWATAHALADVTGLKAQPMPELRERKYGIFEGLTYDQARSEHPEVYARFEARQPDYVFPGGGESLLDLFARVVSALESIVARHRGETVLLVTHGGVLDVVNRFARGLPLDTPRDFAIPNAGLNRLSLSGDRWQVEDWALTAHLEGALDEL